MEILEIDEIREMTHLIQTEVGNWETLLRQQLVEMKSSSGKYPRILRVP